MKSRKNTIANFALPFFFVAVIFVIAATGVSAQEKQDANLVRQAKITLEQAREIAQKKAAGKIESEELEREHGKLIYSFDIRNSKGTITEVQVDAKTGKLVSVKEESKKDEKNEKQQEEREKTKKNKKN